ncbi:hypothetical protein F5B19DRAFT_494918 [Rostrohypoxylon terebratum]|nr:hypothetical protein F5B19DRAFT_494918 [Rostrohypoxylon terebratum]
MDNTSQRSEHGSALSNTAPASNQADRVRLTAQSAFAYNTSVAMGNAPVNTLLQNGSTGSRVRTRKTKVQREIDEAMAKFNQSSTKYVSLICPIKTLQIGCRRGLKSPIKSRGVVYNIVG